MSSALWPTTAEHNTYGGDACALCASQDIRPCTGPRTTQTLARALGSDWVWTGFGSGLVPFGLALGSLSWAWGT
ncbi:hypothetical protein ACFX12_022550 [Malus domestica]